ncbi:hypothetical protein MMC21_003528 [Puttea exsequens]|nr:hypothetical protein [Puttea exsequens]
MPFTSPSIQGAPYNCLRCAMLSYLLQQFLLLSQHFCPQTNKITSSLSSSNPTFTQVPHLLFILPRQGFTDPLLPAKPSILTQTGTAERIVSGSTLFITYTIVIAAGYSTAPAPASSSSSPTTISSVPLTALFPHAIGPITAPAGGTTPQLNLGPCSTATSGGQEALEACEASIVASFNGVIEPSAMGETGVESSGAVATSAALRSVSPTTTVTRPYMGAVIAKGEATWGVGGGENRGSRVRGRDSWWWLRWVGAWFWVVVWRC